MTNEKFTVVDHKYFNTGGNTMVSVFTVYDHAQNVSRYVIAGDEAISYQTADTVTNCDLMLDTDERINAIVLDTYTFEQLTYDFSGNGSRVDGYLFDLLKYCEYEHYKQDCKHYGYKQNVAIESLPAELLSRLSEDYINWARAEGAGCYTDGYDVYMDTNYEPPVVDNRHAPAPTDIEQFVSFLDSYVRENEVAFGARSYITVAVSGDSIKIPLNDDSLTLLLDFLGGVAEKC